MVEKCGTSASNNGPQKWRRAAMKQYNVESIFVRTAIDVAIPSLGTKRIWNSHLLLK